MKFFATVLLKWYDKHGRQDLPWRQNISPYRVWLSEIMLQQTQVKTVIDYFNGFIEKFPSIIHLANVHEDEVLHLWSGLGYYSRARNLHQTAKIIRDNYEGNFPRLVAELEQLPGVGRSTAGAISAIAFKQTAAILDGNVKRVLTRFFALEGWPGSTANLKILWRYAESLTPKKRPDDYAQAIMDLGAMLCTRTKPKCHLCPVAKHCLSFQNNLTDKLPESKPKKTIPVKSTLMLIIKNEHDHILLEKRPPVGIWGGLWCLPVCDISEDVAKVCYDTLSIGVALCEKLPPFRHTFSHYHLDIHPIILTTKSYALTISDAKPLLWYDHHNPISIGLAAPIKKLLASM